MALKRKLKKENVKPNVVPILDAVFIFIFFLLMSAQFIDIFEIGSDAPAVSMVDTEKNDKPPLNLILKITSGRITVTTGMDENVVKHIETKNGDFDYELLKNTLAKLKAKHIDESSVVLRPNNNVEYQKLVKIMDTARELASKDPIIQGQNKLGKQVQTKKMFDNIIFETVI